RGMRKAVAEHVLNSLKVSAQLTGMSEVDMTEIIRLRKSFLQQEEKIGVRISYTDILVYILAKTIKSVPQVNASMVGNEIKIWEDINIGIAVALQTGEYESGLIVPVVKNADRKNLTEISRCVKDLTSRARNGELTPEDMTCGTITLSNTGTFVEGWGVTTPIINQPEALMVQPGKIKKR
ncbi:MAG: 2-oxo acid dehydrogenase subunit E2, partial [bacterium]|nr:2-oxo acid dehydrogenase subunit E2 [bacterium]